MARSRDAVLFFGGTLLSQALTFVSGVFVARWLGPANYGALSIARSLYGVAAILAPLGLDLSLLRHLGEHGDDWPRSLSHVRSLRRLALAVNLAVMLVVVVCGGRLVQAHVFHLPHLAAYLALSFIALPLSADVAILSATFRALDAVTFQNVAALYVQPLVRVGALFLLLALGFGIPGVLVATALGLAASNLVMNVALRRAVRQRGLARHRHAPEDRRAVRSILGYSGWLAAMLLMVLLPRSLDVLVLGWSRPVREVGSYAALSAISTLITIAPASVSQTLAPRIAGLYAEGELDAIRRELSSYPADRPAVDLPPVRRPGRVRTLARPRLRGQVRLPGSAVRSAFAVRLPQQRSGAHGLVADDDGPPQGGGALAARRPDPVRRRAMLLAPRYGGPGVALASVVAYLVVNAARLRISSRLLGGADIRLADGLAPALCLGLALVFKVAAQATAPHTLRVCILTILDC